MVFFCLCPCHCCICLCHCLPLWLTCAVCIMKAACWTLAPIPRKERNRTRHSSGACPSMKLATALSKTSWILHSDDVHGHLNDTDDYSETIMRLWWWWGRRWCWCCCWWWLWDDFDDYEMTMMIMRWLCNDDYEMTMMITIMVTSPDWDGAWCNGHRHRLPVFSTHLLINIFDLHYHFCLIMYTLWHGLS